MEKLITEDAKKFLAETDLKKLIMNHEDVMKEKEQEIFAQLRSITKEITQKEKELIKMKEEVYKVIIGESQFSQSLLSELIQAKERELDELRKKNKEAETKVEDIKSVLMVKRAACSDLNNWSERFDLQETSEKKSMLINLID